MAALNVKSLWDMVGARTSLRWGLETLLAPSPSLATGLTLPKISYAHQTFSKSLTDKK